MGKARAKKKPRRSDFGVKRQPLLEIRKFALSLHKSKLKPPQIVQVLTEKGTKVSPRTVQHWVKNAQKVCRSPGRPPLANAQRVVDKLDDLIEATGNAPSQQDFLEKLNEVATETFVAAGGTRRQFRNQQPMHRSTVLKYKKEAMLSPVQARFKPPARDEHGQSIRNPVVEFLLYDSLVHFYVEHPEWQVHPMNIQNIDPVSLAFNGESRIACFSTPKSRKKRKPPTRARAKTKPFTIKCLPLLMADGRIADPFIALMVCLDVPKGQIWKVKIPGFSPNTDGTGEIWLLRTLHGEDLRLANREFLRGKFRSGIITEYSLDLLCTNQQRAIAFTWASGEEGYEEWLEVKRAKAQTEVEKAAEKKQQEDDKKEEAKIAKDRKEEKNRQEKAMRDCCATLSAPAPLPKDMDDDTESGVRFPWNHCRKCETWWCPKCLSHWRWKPNLKKSQSCSPLKPPMTIGLPWTGEKFYCWLTLTRKKKTSACEPHCDCEDPCDCPNNPGKYPGTSRTSFFRVDAQIFSTAQI